jgi:hypothetical protein
MVCLGSYSAILTIVLVIISILYHNCGSLQPICSNGKQEIQNHLDILNVDVSSNEVGKMENGTCTCDVIKYLGFEIFEIIMLVVLMLTIIYMGFKIQGSGKIWWNKWKESREAAKEVKFHNRRAQYEATTSTSSKRGKVHVETFVHGKRETKREPREPRPSSKPATYEKGDNYNSDNEGEYQEEEYPEA